MAKTQKKAVGIPTIDVSLVVVRTGVVDGDDTNATEIAVDTANKVGVEPQTETTDAIKLVKLGRLIAQKPATTTITGHQITLTDNVFIPELVKILQGGTVEGTGDTLTYTPPVAGSTDKGQVFELDCYSAQYDASGQIVRYEKITYPNCQGTPVAMSSEDDVFRVPEYTINSAPKEGEAPYKISYVKTLPQFTDVAALSDEDSFETGLAVN
ncbi:hypothetical protein [Holdemanella sp.]|uniref:hypothetical protein n=1 Tax=Holdemanella sp. TaxID=1971762 RepID=UPI003AF143FB